MHGTPPARRLVALALVFLVSLVLPLMVQADYYFLIINVTLTNLVLALGLDLLVGRSGQFAFAHIAFFGIGAYATALLQGKLGLPFLFSLPLAAALAGILGVLIAIPATRMRNINLALATFAFAQGMQWLFGAWEGLTGGANGLNAPAPVIFGLEIGNDAAATPWMAALALLCLAALMFLSCSRLGRSMAAIRESESAAAVSGVNVRRVKIITFGISSVYAGLAGGMLALHETFLELAQFGFTALVLVFSMIVIGGLGSVAGTVIGAIALTLLPELLRAFMRDLLIWQEFVYGLILILCMMFMPRGIWGGLRRLATRRARA